jgi:aromatic ring hydroxylase
MALKTSQEYVDRLKRMKPNVYAHGRKIGRDDPMLQAPINTLRFTPKFLYSDTGRYLAGTKIYHEYDILASVAGGLPSTIPTEEDWINPATGPDLEKCISRKPGVPAEKLRRLFRFISVFSCSAMGGWTQYAGIHGGGSPVMEKIGVRSEVDLESKKKIAKFLAGIRDDE